MSYVLTNVSVNRTIVCTLNDGNTLRLFPKSSVTLTEDQITGYLKKLASDDSKLLTITEVEKKSLTRKSASNKEAEVEEKEV